MIETITKQNGEIVSLLRELKLRHFCDAFEKDMAILPITSKEIITSHMASWAMHERNERKTQLIAAKIKYAKFRQEQTVDTFNFKHNKMIEKIEKTYLARALGYAACQKWLSVLFLTTAEMVSRLQHAENF